MKNEKHKYTPGEREYSHVCNFCRKSYFECYAWVRIWTSKKRTPSEVTKGLNSGLPLGRIMYEPQMEINTDISMIDTTLYTSTLLTTNGEVYTWGTNSHSLGRAEMNYEDCYKPKAISSLKGIVIVGIACGFEHVLALESGMYVWSWGSNGFGQLGNKDAVQHLGEPKRIGEINQIVRIAAGNHSSFAVDIKGTLYSWGNNNKYQIGQPENKDPYYQPTEMPIAPWLKRQKREEFNKSYFKQAQPKELKINGMSKSDLKQLQIESNDLKRRINNMIKRVDILDDVLNNAAKYITDRWLTDDIILNIIKVKHEMEIQIELSKTNKENMTEAIKLMSSERRQKEHSIEQIEEKLGKVNQIADETELELESAKIQLEKSREMLSVGTKKDNGSIKTQQERVEEMTRYREVYYVKSNKLKHRLAKYEKEKAEIHDKIQQMKHERMQQKNELSSVGNKLELYNKMINIAKKRIVDDYLESDESYDASLLKELQFMAKVHRSLSYLENKSIKSQFQTLDKTKRHKYIMKALDRYEKELRSTNRITQYSLVELVHKTWGVVTDNLALRKQILSHKMTMTHLNVEETIETKVEIENDETLLDKFNNKAKQQVEPETDRLKQLEEYFVNMFKEAELDIEAFKLEEENETIKQEAPVRINQLQRSKKQKQKESKWRLCGGLFG